MKYKFFFILLVSFAYLQSCQKPDEINNFSSISPMLVRVSTFKEPCKQLSSSDIADQENQAYETQNDSNICCSCCLTMFFRYSFYWVPSWGSCSS